MSGQNFGSTLFDQVPQIYATLSQYHGFLSDANAFYTAHAQLEREYANGLKALLRKSQEKRAKRVGPIVVGESPSKAFRDGDVRNHTLDSCWVKTLSVADEMASDRLKLADELDETAISLKTLESKSSTLLKNHHTFYTSKLLAERDRLEEDRKSKKAQYDSACSEVESARHKLDGGKDPERAQRNFNAAEGEMAVAKNTYLLSIEVANESKKIFYDRDLPEMHDHYQLIWTLLVARFSEVLKQYCVTFDGHIAFWHAANQRMVQSVDAVQPANDQDIYIEYNKRNFFPPSDQQFEPCAFWHDNSSLSMDGNGKPFLQSILANRQRQLTAPSQLEAKLQEMNKLKDLLATYSSTPSLGNTQEMAENMLEAFRQASVMRIDKEACATEQRVCEDALDGDVGAQALHDFKPSSFAKPAKCLVCDQNIWGMSKSTGLSCKACGVACHQKCEIKVLADCSKGRPRATGGVTGKSSPTSSTKSKRISVGSFSGFGSMRKAPPTAEKSSRASASEDKQPTATMLYDFEAQSAFEISIQANATVQILVPDSDGWTKVQSGSVKGLVPTAYLKMTAESLGTGSAPSVIVAPYEAADKSQLTVNVDDTVDVLGPDEGGWTRVKDASGLEGFVPTWAVQSA